MKIYMRSSLAAASIIILSIICNLAVPAVRGEDGYVTHGVKKGVDVTVNGTKKGIDAGVSGTKKGIDVSVAGTKKGCGRPGAGVKKGVKETKKFIHKVF